jgi:hypothetical protein
MTRLAKDFLILPATDSTIRASNAASVFSIRNAVNLAEKDVKMIEQRDIPHVERFTPTDLMMLRAQLADTTVDSFQAAEIVANFLSGRGYGISQNEARLAVERIDCARGSVEHMQAELERVAMVM